MKTIFTKAQGKHTCFEDKMSINEGDAELEKKSSHLTLKSYSCVKEKISVNFLLEESSWVWGMPSLNIRWDSSDLCGISHISCHTPELHFPHLSDKNYNNAFLYFFLRIN